MKCEVNVIVVIEVDDASAAQDVADQIMYAAESAHPSAVGFGANWTVDPEKFTGDYGDVPDILDDLLTQAGGTDAPA